jgi:hypothetical protein
MKNTLTDLNDHLFMCLERLNDESFTQEQIDQEVKRCDAVTKIATTIVANANTQLNAYKYVNDCSASPYREIPKNILGNKDDQIQKGND